jgi:pimeloyl-ACP methyl ester carboxylesterase
MRPFLVPELLRDLGFPAKTLLKSRWTRVNGRRMHSRSSERPGAGDTPFLLIHGLVISSLYMIPLAECLAETHSVHALDLPGFGRSEGGARALSIVELADAVDGWMRETGLGPCHLIGNSMGCEVAAQVAVRHPQRVASLLLIGPTIDPKAFAFPIQALRLLRDAVHEPARLWMNWIFDFFRAGIRRAFGTTREMFRDHIEEQLPLIQVPTLLMRGAHDPTVPQSAAEEMLRLLPGARLLVMEGEFHCVHYTKPRAVCEAAKNHASGIPS